jgi:hypothetical protein
VVTGRNGSPKGPLRYAHSFERKGAPLMKGHSTLVLCDACGDAIAEQTAKEVLYQVDKLRYRLELCPTCLDREMKLRDGHRGIPGMHKRAAIAFSVSSKDDLPRPLKPRAEAVDS